MIPIIFATWCIRCSSYIYIYIYIYICVCVCVCVCVRARVCGNMFSTICQRLVCNHCLQHTLYDCKFLTGSSCKVLSFLSCQTGRNQVNMTDQNGPKYHVGSILSNNRCTKGLLYTREYPSATGNTTPNQMIAWSAFEVHPVIYKD